jgi:PTS system N-acetylglucosamine-specific IIA component
MPTTVLAPVAGTVVGLTAVPDPVFAEALVGPGTAIEPVREPGVAVAPVDGTVAKLHPHAFVVVTADGRGVLVHLGIDTVKLHGEGFETLAAEGDAVAVGDPLVRWNPADIEARGLSPVCPVVALDASADALTGAFEGSVAVGAELFVWH